MQIAQDQLHKGYYKIFIHKVLTSIQPMVEKAMKDNKDEISLSLHGDILGIDNIAEIKTQKTDEEILKAKIFYSLVEIVDTFDRINEFKHYISIFPFKSKKISKSGYLNLINESFFHELYILSERLTAFLPSIIKKYKGTPYYKNGRKVSTNLTKSIKSTFKNARVIRDSHVHRSRYENKEIKRLSTLELLQLSDDKDFATEIKNIYEPLYKKTRKQLRETYTKTVQDIETSLDYYFWAADSFLFKGDLIVLPEKKEK